MRHAGLDHIFDLGHRHGGRGDREGHNWRIGRVHFAVDRRVRQVRGQQVGGGVDGRLHFLLSDVQRQRELELERDHRRAAGALGGHLLKAGHLAKLPLQRGGHRRGHHVRAGAGIERYHLNRRVVHFRQRRNR